MVGGGFTVDKTALIYAKWDDIPDSVDGYNQPTGDALAALIQVVNKEENADPNIKMSNVKSGTTRWHAQGAYPRPRKEATGLMKNAAFSSSVDLSDFVPGDRIAVFAVAVLDQFWSTPPDLENLAPELPPQSHIVNARTNTEWNHDSSNRIIEGRVHWFSIPVTINIVPGHSDTEEAAFRMMPPRENKIEELENVAVDDVQAHIQLFMFSFFAFFLCILGFLIYKRELRRRRTKFFSEITQEIEGMELGGVDYEPTERFANHTIE